MPPAQLDIGLSGLTGAAIYSGVVLSYRGTSSRSCRLESYPSVAGVTATNSTEMSARDKLGGYLGSSSGESAFMRVPPTLVQRGRGGAAPSMVERWSVGTYTEVSPRRLGVGHHAMVFDEMQVRVDCGGPWALEALAPTSHGFDAVWYKSRADAYVRGAVGKWEPTLPTE
ncbi:MAG: hypothetical protein M0Z46_21880 [Actinomycetota bacterium]|jgi:hypothetical protein|nr:hypothetical protein [Actinomycetota bacterium]